MLHAQWLKTLKYHANKVAVTHPEIQNPQRSWTFKELDDRARDIVKSPTTYRLSETSPTQEFFVARADRTDFLPTILAGWISQRPTLLLETSHCQARMIQGKIPPHTTIIKQSCGATGLERSLFLGEHQIMAECQRNIDTFQLHPKRPGLAAISLAHSYGFASLALPVLLGGIPIDILSSPMPMNLQEAYLRHDDVFLPAVPTLWKTWWLTQSIKKDIISLAVSAGSPLSLSLESDIFTHCQLKIHNFYGTSETGAIAFDFSETPRSEASLLGTILPGVSVKTISQNGFDNRFLIASNAIALGADVLQREDEFAGNSYLTMDQGEISNDQSLHWHHHIGLAINVAGRKVSPSKIKRICQDFPGVIDVSVTRTPSRDQERFEEVSIHVTLENPQTLPDLKKFAYRHLESWEFPRHWSTEAPPH